MKGLQGNTKHENNGKKEVQHNSSQTIDPLTYKYFLTKQSA